MADTTVERVRIEITAESKEAEAKVNALKKALDSVRGKRTTEVEASGVQRATAAYSTMKRKVSGVGKEMQAAKKMALSFTKSLLGVNAVKNSFKDLKNNISKLGSSLGRIALYRAMRSAIKNFTQGIREGIQNLYQYSSVVGTQFKRSLDSMATAALYVKNSIATIAEPIINKIAPVLDALSDKFANLAAQVAEFLAKLTGSETYTRALKFPVAYADAANGAAKAMQKWLGPFDEINRLSAPSGSGSGAAIDYSKMFETIEVNNDSPISKFVDMLKDGIAKGDLSEVGGMISGKIRDALNNIDWPTIQKKAENIASNIGTFLNGFFTEPGFAESVGTSVAEAINTGLTFASTFFKKTNFYGIGLSIGTMIRTGFEKLDSEKLANTITGYLSGVLKGIQGFVNSGALREVARKLGETLGKILSDKQFWLDCFAAAGGVALALGDAIIALIEGAWERITGKKLNLPSLSNTSTSNGGSVEPTIIGGGLTLAYVLKKLGVFGGPGGGGAAGGGAAGAGAGGGFLGSLANFGAALPFFVVGTGVSAALQLEEQGKLEDTLKEWDDSDPFGGMYAPKGDYGVEKMLDPKKTENTLNQYKKTIERQQSTLSNALTGRASKTSKDLISTVTVTTKNLSNLEGTYAGELIKNMENTMDTTFRTYSKAGNNIVRTTDGFMQASSTSVRQGTGLMKNLFIDNTGKIVGTVKDGFFSTEKSISGSLNNSKNVISTVWGNIKTSVSSYVDQVTSNTKKGFENTTSTIETESRKWVNPARAGIQAAKEAIEEATKDTETNTKKNMEGVTSSVTNESKKWVTPTREGTRVVKEAIENATKDLGTNLESTTNNSFGRVKTFGQNTTRYIVDAFGLCDDAVARHLNNIDKNATNKLNNVVKNANATGKALSTLNGSSLSEMPPVGRAKGPSIVGIYGDGGFVNSGEAFIARESGPEFVGRIGNRTAVANNAQIVAGIAEGVEVSNMGVVNAIYAVANQIVGAIKSNGGGGVDWDSITRQISRTQARQAVSANI